MMRLVWWVDRKLSFILCPSCFRMRVSPFHYHCKRRGV